MNVSTLCLAILNFGEASGYDIRKMSTEGTFSHFVDASYGAIYPALERLESEGKVEQRMEQQVGKPAAGCIRSPRSVARRWSPS
jgi:PadR family transcriptional regulator AphA